MGLLMIGLLLTLIHTGPVKASNPDASSPQRNIQQHRAEQIAMLASKLFPDADEPPADVKLALTSIFGNHNGNAESSKARPLFESDWYRTVWRRKWQHRHGVHTRKANAGARDLCSDVNSSKEKESGGEGECENMGASKLQQQQEQLSFPQDDPLFTRGLLTPESIQLGPILDMFNAVPSSLTLMNTMRVRSSTGQRVKTTKRMVRRLVKSESAMHEFLDAGKCIVFLLERLADCVDEASPAAAPLRTLQHVMNEHLGGLATVHLWLSGREGSKALQLHADEYDFILIQLNGTKEWEVCVPAPVVPSLPEADEADGWWNDARTAGLHDLFIHSNTYNEAIREAEQLVKDREKPGSQNGFKIAETAKPLVLNLNEGSSTPYSNIDTTDPLLQCTNLTVRAGDRIYMPRGMLHRAVTSAGGSAHLSVALPLAPGLTWADVIAGGLERDKSLTPTDASSGGIRSDGDSAAAVVDDDHHRFSTGVGTTSFWSPGPLGGVRTRTKVMPGQCASGERCKSELVGKLMFALRHNADTNGPFALVPESVLLAEPLPMWIVKKYLQTIRGWRKKQEVQPGYTEALLMEVVAETPLYKEYKALVDGAVVSQLFAMNPTPGALGDPAELADLIKWLGTPTHFVKGLLRVRQVLGYNVNQKECPKEKKSIPLEAKLK